MRLQGELHAALDAPIGPDTSDDDLGLADAIDSALPLTDEVARLLRRAGAERQQQGKDGRTIRCNNMSPPVASQNTRKGDISAASQPSARGRAGRTGLAALSVSRWAKFRCATSQLMPSIPHKA